MKSIYLAFIILFLIVTFSFNRAMANEDVYPFIWKNEYKYFVDPTFHTVKFCNDYKNVLCVSDSTIEILDAENGKSLRKKKYDFDNDLVEVSAKDNLIAICVQGGYWLNLIDFNTLEIIQSSKMDGRILDFKFFNNNLYLSHTSDAKSSTLSIFDLVTFQSKEDIKTDIRIDNFVISNKNNVLYFLHIYITGSGSSQQSNTTLNSFDLIDKKIIEIKLLQGHFGSLELSPIENYLGLINDENSQITVFDLKDIQKPTEIKEIDFNCFEYCFSYDEKYIMFDYSSNISTNTYLFDIEQFKIINKLQDNARGKIEFNQLNNCLTYKIMDGKDRYLTLRPHGFYSTVSDTKKNLIEIHNNFIIINYIESRSINQQIIISDINGREIKKYNKTINNNNPIDLNFLPRGVYLITLSSNNNIIETLKFIKE